MIHSSLYQPNIFPVGAGTPSVISRAQAIDPTANTNFQRVKEIGRLYTVGYVRKIPSVTYRMTQYEYGSFNFWQQITNKPANTTLITLQDFRTSAFDIAAYTTDDVGEVYRGVMLYPFMRVSGFSINIGNPDATIERTFNFIGEQQITWSSPMKNLDTMAEVNPYYVEVDFTAGSGSDNTIDLSNWTPLRDPDVDPAHFSVAQQYLFRVVLIRAGITYLLIPSNGSDGYDYTFNHSTNQVSLTGNTYTVTAGDVYKVWFITATTFSPDFGTTIAQTSNTHGDPIYPTQLFAQDNTDAAGLNATSASIFLYVPGSGQPNAHDYLYRIQSCTIDVSFERSDLKEIGNRSIVQLGINLNKVSVKLGRILEKYTIDQVLRGEAADFGKLDLTNYCPNLNLGVSMIVKFYTDDTKTTLAYGMISEKLAPQDINQGASANQYVRAGATLDGEFLNITTDNAQLDEHGVGFTGPLPVNV